MIKTSVMKKIKILVAVIALFGALESGAQNIITSEQVEVAIQVSTTREQLTELRNQLLAQGIKFNYVPKFDANRALSAIRYQLKDSNDNLIGEFNKEAFATVSTNAGFKLQKQNGVFVASCVGNCP